MIRANFRKGELIGLVRMSEIVADHAIGVGVNREPTPYGALSDVRELCSNLLSINLK